MFRILFPLLLLILLSTPATGTEEYARQTGQSCATCHLDPAGGGELTPAGRSFAAGQSRTGEKPAPSPAARGIRFAAGYVHILVAFLWFGTILYVHLVLKPAYASSGLPRGEMRVGILSMIVMGISGAVLFYYRVPSADMLLHTRFGVLLAIKIALYLTMVISAAFVIMVIGPRLKAQRKPGPGSVAGGDMTGTELALCDGKDGHPTMFAYQGTIYDATNSRFWKSGSHMGRHQAGMDLTAALSQAPHGEDLLARLATVGHLIQDQATVRPLHERVFYFMAYMNLVIVFLIVLILALWRWW